MGIRADGLCQVCCRCKNTAGTLCRGLFWIGRDEICRHRSSNSGFYRACSTGSSAQYIIHSLLASVYWIVRLSQHAIKPMLEATFDVPHTSEHKKNENG